MKQIFFFYLSLILFPCVVHAGAWTQKEGVGQHITTTTYYQSDEFYDTDGVVQDQEHFSKSEVTFYAEYGITDDITIGGSLDLEYNASNLTNETNYGVGDSEVFLRYNWWEEDGWVISTESLVKLPTLADNENNAAIGTDNTDMSQGIAVGYGFEAYRQNHYISLDSAYRYRSGDQADQIRTNLTAGIGLTENFTLMPQVFTIFRTEVPDNAPFTQSPEDDFNLVKFQLSGLYDVEDFFTVQLGAFGDLDGDNTGKGYGAVLAFWKSF